MSISGISMTSFSASIQTTQYGRNGTKTESVEFSFQRVDAYEAREPEAQEMEGTIYKPNTALVDQLKADMETQKAALLNTVRDMLNKQGIAVAEGEGIWKQIAGGNYTVDEETRAAAQASISDGGYWSVEKTSERLAGYAKALVGGDPSKVEMMRDAFVQGYQEAEKLWGGKLPEISQKTYDATMKLFDDWANEGQDAESLRTA